MKDLTEIRWYMDGTGNRAPLRLRAQDRAEYRFTATDQYVRLETLNEKYN